LVVVLVITSVLFLGSMFLLKVSKESIRTAQCLVDKLNARIVAESTVEAFKFLGSTGAFNMNKLMSGFGDDIGMKGEIPLDGTVAGLGENTRIQALDAAAKLNVWGCNAAHVAKMFEILSGDGSKGSEIQDCLLDWFDSHDLKRLNGAKSYYYQTEQGYRYGPRNYSAAQCVEELSLVKGLDDPRVWAMLKNELILAPATLPNLNTMDKTMLRAVLGINEDTADSLLATRKANGYLSYLDASSATGIIIPNLVDLCSMNASRIINLSIETVSGDARESVRLLVNFRPDKEAPFRVLEAAY
jgi:DNA uptake protein ComE-like DNA-binding protein